MNPDIPSAAAPSAARPRLRTTLAVALGAIFLTLAAALATIAFYASDYDDRAEPDSPGYVVDPDFFES